MRGAQRVSLYEPVRYATDDEMASAVLRRGGMADFRGPPSKAVRTETGLSFFEAVNFGFFAGDPEKANFIAQRIIKEATALNVKEVVIVECGTAFRQRRAIAVHQASAQRPDHAAASVIGGAATQTEENFAGSSNFHRVADQITRAGSAGTPGITLIL